MASSGETVLGMAAELGVLQETNETRQLLGGRKGDNGPSAVESDGRGVQGLASVPCTAEAPGGGSSAETEVLVNEYAVSADVNSPGSEAGAGQAANNPSEPEGDVLVSRNETAASRPCGEGSGLVPHQGSTQLEEVGLANSLAKIKQSEQGTDDLYTHEFGAPTDRYNVEGSSEEARVDRTGGDLSAGGSKCDLKDQGALDTKQKELEQAQASFKDISEAYMLLINTHNDERELILGKGRELKVALQRLKKLRDATEKEMKEASRKHKAQCISARKKILALQKDVDDLQVVVNEKLKEREKQKQEQRLEVGLASAEILNLQATLESLVKAKEDMEAEDRNHLAVCKAARRQVLQLQHDIQQLKKEVEDRHQDPDEDRERKALEHELVQGEVGRLKQEKHELLEQKTKADATDEEARKLEEDCQMALKARLNLQHEVLELKRALAEQHKTKEKEKQKHLAKCKLAHREAKMLEEELKQLSQQVQQSQQESKVLASAHEDELKLSQMGVTSLREEVHALRLQRELQNVQHANSMDGPSLPSILFAADSKRQNGVIGSNADKPSDSMDIFFGTSLDLHSSIEALNLERARTVHLGDVYDEVLEPVSVQMGIRKHPLLSSPSTGDLTPSTSNVGNDEERNSSSQAAETTEATQVSSNNSNEVSDPDFSAWLPSDLKKEVGAVEV